MSRHCRNRRSRLLAFAIGIAFASMTAPALACPGDCDGSLDVTVDEIVTLINIALGNVALENCTAGDVNDDGEITVEEIVRTLDVSLNGCPLPVGTPTPTPTATPSATATVTTTATPTATITPDVNAPVVVSYDFRNGSSGWQAGFADYPAIDEEAFELVAEIAPIPPETGLFGASYVLSGNNLSDDLFMFLKRGLGPEDGIRPGFTYVATFTLRFASNAPSGCPGIGGAPGESVFLKAGAGPAEPLTFVDSAGDVRMTVDKGNQSEDGPAAANVGNIANGLPCDEVDPGNPPFVSITRSLTDPFPATADANGRIWLLIGTDSGFEGRTTLYYQRITVNLTPAS